MPWRTSRPGTPPAGRPDPKPVIAKPATILITKVTIKGMKQAVQMFGPAQYAVAKAVADCVAEGTIPATAADELVIVCGVFLHPSPGRGQRQDRQVQPRGHQARHPAGHEELASH